MAKEPAGKEKKGGKSRAKAQDEPKRTVRKRTAAQKAAHQAAGLPGFVPDEDAAALAESEVPEPEADEEELPEEAEAEEAEAEAAEAAEPAQPAKRAPAPPEPSLPGYLGGYSDKNEFGKRGPLLPTYEEVSRIIAEGYERTGSFPKSPGVVKAAKGSPRVCMRHYNRIYQEYVAGARESVALREEVDRQSERMAALEAELAALNARMEEAEKQARARRAEMWRGLSYLSGNMMSLFLMPWADEGARANLCREMFAELPRLAGLADDPPEEERVRAENRRFLMEKDSGELGAAVDRLRAATEKGELAALLRRETPEALSRAVSAFCWFTPEDRSRDALLRGLFEAEAEGKGKDRRDEELAVRREELARRVALDLCRPLLAVCRDPYRDEVAAFAGRLPQNAGLLNGRVEKTLAYLLDREERREALSPMAAAMFWQLARAGNTRGLDLLLSRFEQAIRDAADDADQLGRLADLEQAAALRWILERWNDWRERPAISRATAGAVLRRIFAGDAGPRDGQAKSALAGCVFALIQHGAELDDDMRGRIRAARNQEFGALATPEEAGRILALDELQRRMREAGIDPDDQLGRLGLRHGDLITAYTYGLPLDKPEALRAFLERRRELLGKKRKLNI